MWEEPQLRRIDIFQVDDHTDVPIRQGKMLPLEQLKIGESIRFPIRQRRSVQTVSSKLKLEIGMIFTVKKEDEQWCRIWRIS